MAAGDLFWDAVYVAMHMDDASLTEIKGNAFTLTGGVTRSSTQSKFGGYSAHFDGVNDEVTNTSLWDVQGGYQSAQFFVYPETQLMANPCVFSFRTIKVEYKPSGYDYGFVISVDGVRTPCGVHPEGNWYFVWMTISGTTLTLYIDNVFISTFTTASYSGGSPEMFIGSSNLYVNTDSAFKGYIDDLLVAKDPTQPINGSLVRTDHSIPTAAFLERLPDPEGEAQGSVALTGTCAGIVAPIGGASSSIRIQMDGDADVPCAGIGTGRVRLSGLSYGTIGRFGVGAGSIRITGLGLAFQGRTGAAQGSIRLGGNAVAKHGVSGAGDGVLTLTGIAVGTTPEKPVGQVSGAIRVTGNAVGIGGVVEDYCQ